jgi:RNA polymerase sigma-70 factor (ECF subfamily)
MLDEQAYARHLQPLLPRAAGYARSILRDRHRAEDAVQQAALRGLQRLGTYDETRAFPAWWFSILRNCCVDMIREAQARPTVSLDRLDPPTAVRANTPDWERLAECMDQLTVDHREILRLRYFSDLSYRELAETLSIPQGTVMSRLFLARAALGRKMRGEDV